MESLNSPQNTSVNVSSEIDKAIKTAAAKHKVDEKLIRSLIKAESGFDVSAVSKKGAIGLMQLMPETAKSLGVRNPLDISENIDAGTKYFKRLMKNYDNNLDLSLAAYNAGPGNVKKYKGIPPFEETQSYIKKIKENLEYYKNVEI
jgi:soluble lytic murein transglycosylase-like protein